MTDFAFFEILLSFLQKGQVTIECFMRKQMKKIKLTTTYSDWKDYIEFSVQFLLIFVS